MIKITTISLTALILAIGGCSIKTVPDEDFYNSNIKKIDVNCGALFENEFHKPIILKFEESIITKLIEKGYEAKPADKDIKNYTLMSSYLKENKSKINCDAILNVVMDIGLSRNSMKEAKSYTVHGLGVTYGLVNMNGDAVLSAKTKINHKEQRIIENLTMSRDEIKDSLGRTGTRITEVYTYGESEEQFLDRVAGLILENLPSYE
jgi:hypothetical protein